MCAAFESPQQQITVGNNRMRNKWPLLTHLLTHKITDSTPISSHFFPYQQIYNRFIKCYPPPSPTFFPQQFVIIFNILSIILKLYPKKNSAKNCTPSAPSAPKNSDYMFNNKFNLAHLYSVLKRMIYPKFLMEKGSGKQLKMHLNN